MGRPLRLTYLGALHHVTMRCNNKEFLFDPRSQRMFLDLLRECCAKFDVPLYNYCLMTNHVHLLFTVGADDVLSPFMHRLANVFAKRFNAMRGRKGHLWEGRFVSTVVEPQTYFFRCMAYIDLNPVRAGMADHPIEYAWCGHRHLAAEDQTIIRLHELYLQLGDDPESRYRTYLELVGEEAERKPHSLAGALFVGSDGFASRMLKRFGIEPGRSPRVRRADLGSGVRCVELIKGGSRGKFVPAP